MLFLELKLHTKPGSSNERMLYSYSLNLQGKKKQWNCSWKKNKTKKESKAVKENELTVTVKKAFMRIHFILEIYMYRQK